MIRIVTPLTRSSRFKKKKKKKKEEKFFLLLVQQGVNILEITEEEVLAKEFLLFLLL